MSKAKTKKTDGSKSKKASAKKAASKTNRIVNSKKKSATSSKSVTKKSVTPSKKKDSAKKQEPKKSAFKAMPASDKLKKQMKEKMVKSGNQKDQKKISPKKTTDSPKSKKEVKSNVVKSGKEKNATPDEKKVAKSKQKSEDNIDQTENENPIKLTEAKLPETKVDYDNATFIIKSQELGFIKLPDETFTVRLVAGVNIKRKDALNFELRGTQPDGTPFGTIFDCVDENEANQFLKEVIEYTKTGDIEVISTTNESTEVQNTSKEEPVTQENIESEKVNLESYNGVPLKREDMNSIIETMKQNEQQGQNNAHINVENNIQQQNTVVENTVAEDKSINVQPAISNTHTPDPNSNPTIPSQNPQLSYDPLTAGVEAINYVSKMTDEQILDGMRQYAKSIEGTLNDTFQVRVQGGLLQSEFRKMLDNCSKEYDYEIKRDDGGFFLNVNKNNYQIRVPENPEEYLKIF